MKLVQEETVVDRLNTSPRLQIARAAGRFSRSMMSLSNKRLQEAGHDLSIEHAIILKHLIEKEGQTQQQLAENTFKHKTSITFLIDKMVRKNLVVRVPDQTDRRNKLIYLTDKGRNILNDAIGSEKIAVFGDPASRMIRAFISTVNGQDLTLRLKDGADLKSLKNVQFIDDETGSVWNLNGTAVEGSLKGEKMGRAKSFVAYWFAWSAFNRDTELWEG